MSSLHRGIRGRTKNRVFASVFILSALLSPLLFNPTSACGQEALSRSSASFAKALREWFPEKISIHGWSDYTTRIRCSNKDLTHFGAKASRTDIGLGPALQIKGSLTVDALPPGLTVVDGANGKKYMLLLQAFLFSPEGKLLWSQQGFPKGDSWVPEKGATVDFTLINAHSGALRGSTAAILAIGDPIFIEGTSETRVILGMQCYRFYNNDLSASYKPRNSKRSQPAARTTEIKRPSSVAKPKDENLQYVKKELHGWKYTEVVSIPEADRKKIFYEIVDYQDKTGDDSGANGIIEKRYGLPLKAVRAIGVEGALKIWPMP